MESTFIQPDLSLCRRTAMGQNAHRTTAVGDPNETVRRLVHVAFGLVWKAERMEAPGAAVLEASVDTADTNQFIGRQRQIRVHGCCPLGGQRVPGKAVPLQLNGPWMCFCHSLHGDNQRNLVTRAVRTFPSRTVVIDVKARHTKGFRRGSPTLVFQQLAGNCRVRHIMAWLEVLQRDSVVARASRCTAKRHAARGGFVPAEADWMTVLSCKHTRHC